MSVRCEYCNGSGLADKEGPRDDELLDRVVLSAVAIDSLRAELDVLDKSHADLAHKLADCGRENERMRAEVDIWTKRALRWERQNEPLRAENERLREVLETVAKVTSPGTRNIDQMLRDMTIACNCARAALSRTAEQNQGEGG